MVTSVRTGVASALVAAVLLLSVGVGRAAQSPPAGGELLQRFFAPPAQPLVSYRAQRVLTASTRGGRLHASLEAWTTLDPRGFTYEVTSEDGSAMIRRKVLIAALDAEAKAVQAGGHAAALTVDNYEFLSVTGDRDDDLVKVAVRPRRKHVMLIDGSLFLKSESAELVRVEGELSQRPSFWTRRVRIVREYETIDGVHVPVSMRSTADVLLAGASTFSMTYKYVTINGQPVDAR
jgi:hypothetical protein